MYWIPPSNQQFNSNTNPFRSLTPQQLRQQYHQRLAEGREGIPQDELQSLFKTLKKGDVLRLQYKSAMSSTKGDGIEVVASNARSLLGGSVEKITLTQKKNPSGVKYFLYKRGNNVSFAVGNMGAVITSVLKESVELDEALSSDDLAKLKNSKTNAFPANKTMNSSQMFDWIVRYGVKLGDWVGQSFFYYDGNVWMLKNGTVSNNGSIRNFRRKVNKGVADALEPALSEVEKLAAKGTIKEETQHLDEAWTADSVSRNADIGSDKGYGINIKNTKTPYKHMLMMRTSGKKIKVRFDFGKDEFVGTAQEVADHVNKILGIKEEFEISQVNEANVPANLMKEFDKMINKYRDSGLKGADSFDKKTILDDEKELRKVFGLLKKGQIDKAWIAYEDLDSELQVNVVPDRIVQFMDKNLSEGAKEIHKKLMRKGIVAPIDKERHPERKGLEGPFRSRKSGKVFYYDPKEGKYYDADSDIYLDVEDVMEDTLDESVVAKKSEKFKAGIPKWFSTVFTGMPKYPTQAIAGWKTELETGSGMPGYITYVLHNDGLGTYTVYRGEGYPKLKIRGDKPLGKFRSPEEAMDFVEKTVVKENLDEALRGILDVKPNSKEWMTGEIRNKKNIEHGRGVSTTFNIGDHISIHPFDGDRYVGAVDRSDPKTYFFVAKYAVKPVKSLGEEVDMENLEEMKFSDAQLDALRAEYGKINKIDPASPTYKKLIDFLNSLPKETIKQLVGAKPPIKFLSKLAFNRFNRMQNPRKYPSDKLGETVTEDVNEAFGNLLLESNVELETNSNFIEESIDMLRSIMKSGSIKSLRFDEGGTIKVDRVSATALVTLYDALNRNNRKKLEETIVKSKKLFLRMVEFALSKVRIQEEYTWDEKRGAYVRTDGEEGPLEVPVLIDKGNPVADEVPHVNKYANSGESKMRRGISESDSAMARELVLFIANDSDTYTRRIQPIIKNLARKISKGVFDQTLAVKGFMYAVEHGIKNYVKEYGDIGKVDKSTKNEVASELLDQFMDEINDKA